MHSRSAQPTLQVVICTQTLPNSDIFEFNLYQAVLLLVPMTDEDQKSPLSLELKSLEAPTLALKPALRPASSMGVLLQYPLRAHQEVLL